MAITAMSGSLGRWIVAEHRGLLWMASDTRSSSGS